MLFVFCARSLQREQSDVVNTYGVTVLDVHGQRKLVFGGAEDGRFGVCILDASGTERAFLGLMGDDEEVALEMRGAGGDASVRLRSVSEQDHGLFEQLLFGDGRGRPSVGLLNGRDGTGFAVHDELGRQTIDCRSDESGRPTITMRLNKASEGQLGGPREEAGFYVGLLGAGNRPSHEVMVSTWYGESGAALTLSSDAPPKAELFDKEGKLIRR